MTNRICVLFALFLSCTVYAADNPAHQTNGCGTDAWGLLVPDKTLISSCAFVEACNNHDICYGRCLAGGDLPEDTCTDESQKSARKQICDTQLQSDINTNNKNRPICGVYASIYRWAVSSFGKDAFHGIIAANGPEDELVKYVKFIAENPDSFDLSEIEKAFVAINNTDFKKKAYIVKFEPEIPRLIIFSFDENDKMIIEIKIKGTLPSSDAKSAE